jgi:hypothetical protein
MKGKLLLSDSFKSVFAELLPRAIICIKTLSWNKKKSIPNEKQQFTCTE